ncbi:MAG: TlpA disulfide reductase family protein, partial [Bdellovibrionia bacterium]
ATLVLSILIVSFVIYWKFGRQEYRGPRSEIQVLMSRAPKVGAKLSEFTAKNINGGTYRFGPSSKFRVVNFWASWCNPCMEELPSLSKFVYDRRDRVEVVAVSNDKNENDIRVVLKAYPQLNLESVHVIYDSEKTLYDLFEVKGLPESFIVSPDGTLLRKIVGAISWDSAEAAAYFESVLGK